MTCLLGQNQGTPCMGMSKTRHTSNWNWWSDWLTNTRWMRNSKKIQVKPCIGYWTPFRVNYSYLVLKKSGHFVKNLVLGKRAYFLISAKARIRNPNDEATQYKVNFVLVNYFSPCIGLQYKLFSFPVWCCQEFFKFESRGLWSQI